MNDDHVELLRCREASEARSAARSLLAGGVTPEVHRDGDEHVVATTSADAEAAARILGLAAPDPEVLSALTDEGDDPNRDLAAAAPPGDVGDDGGVEDDDLEDGEFEIDERGYAAVALAKDEEEARAFGAQLLEHGIGFDVAVADESGFANPLLPAGEARVLRVVENDAPRAVDLLGVDPPRRVRSDPVAGAPADPVPSERRRPATREVHEYLGGRLRLTQRQAVGFVVLYLLALVLVPLAFFYGVRYMLDDDIDVEVPTLPTSEVP